jgi:hypothetical protein
MQRVLVFFRRLQHHTKLCLDDVLCIYKQETDIEIGAEGLIQNAILKKTIVILVQ